MFQKNVQWKYPRQILKRIIVDLQTKIPHKPMTESLLPIITVVLQLKIQIFTFIFKMFDEHSIKP